MPRCKFPYPIYNVGQGVEWCAYFTSCEELGDLGNSQVGNTCPSKGQKRRTGYAVSKAATTERVSKTGSSVLFAENWIS